MSASITRTVVLAAAAVVSALTFGLALAHGAVRPALGTTHAVGHWSGGPRTRISPDGIQFGGKTHVGPDRSAFGGSGRHPR